MLHHTTKMASHTRLGPYPPPPPPQPPTSSSHPNTEKTTKTGAVFLRILKVYRIVDPKREPLPLIRIHSVYVQEGRGQHIGNTPTNNRKQQPHLNIAGEKQLVHIAGTIMLLWETMLLKPHVFRVLLPVTSNLSCMDDFLLLVLNAHICPISNQKSWVCVILL